MCELKIRRRKGGDKGTWPRKKVAGAGRRLHYALPVTDAPGIHQLRELTQLEISSQISNATRIRCVKAGEAERERETAAEETKMRVQKTKREEGGERERGGELSLPGGNWRARRMTVLICTRSSELKVPSGALINLGVREERGPSEDG